MRPKATAQPNPDGPSDAASPIQHDYARFPNVRNGSIAAGLGGKRTLLIYDERMVSEEVRQNLKAARGYGCLFATALGLAMGSVIFVGNIMGDCEPGPGCHDNDGIYILQDLSVALPIAAILGIGMWLVAAILRAVLRPMTNEYVVRVLLIALTLGLVWLSFDPAFEFFFRWTNPAQP